MAFSILWNCLFEFSLQFQLMRFKTDVLRFLYNFKLFQMIVVNLPVTYCKTGYFGGQITLVVCQIFEVKILWGKRQLGDSWEENNNFFPNNRTVLINIYLPKQKFSDFQDNSINNSQRYIWCYIKLFRLLIICSL